MFSSVICSVADKFKLSTAAQITQNDCLKASDWLLTLILTNLSIFHTVVLFSLYFSYSHYIFLILSHLRLQKVNLKKKHPNFTFPHILWFQEFLNLQSRLESNPKLRPHLTNLNCPAKWSAVAKEAELVRLSPIF
jgi:hypothetical protein